MLERERSGERQVCLPENENHISIEEIKDSDLDSVFVAERERNEIKLHRDK